MTHALIHLTETETIMKYNWKALLLCVCSDQSRYDSASLKRQVSMRSVATKKLLRPSDIWW